MNMNMCFYMKMNSRHLLVQLVKDQLPLAKKSETGLQHMLGVKNGTVQHISTTPAANYVSACVRSSSGFQLLQRGHSFQNKSILSR
jgi:hypothetical protein